MSNFIRRAVLRGDDGRPARLLFLHPATLAGTQRLFGRVAARREADRFLCRTHLAGRMIFPTRHGYLVFLGNHHTPSFRCRAA